STRTAPRFTLFLRGTFGMDREIVRIARSWRNSPKCDRKSQERPRTMSLKPTATTNTSLRHERSSFDTLWQALDYAAKGATGLNFYTAKGDLASILSYAQLQAEAQDVARRLIGLGLERGARVVLVADTDADFVVSFFAT